VDTTTLHREDAERKSPSPGEPTPAGAAVDDVLLAVLAQVGGMPGAIKANITRDESGRWRQVELIADEAAIHAEIAERQKQRENTPAETPNAEEGMPRA
jgi:hypothetical protein